MKRFRWGTCVNCRDAWIRGFCCWPCARIALGTLVLAEVARWAVRSVLP